MTTDKLKVMQAEWLGWTRNPIYDQKHNESKTTIPSLVKKEAWVSPDNRLFWPENLPPLDYNTLFTQCLPRLTEEEWRLFGRGLAQELKLKWWKEELMIFDLIQSILTCPIEVLYRRLFLAVGRLDEKE